MDRHLNEDVFVKCGKRSCCNEFRLKVAKEILGAERKLPLHSPHRNLERHYKTFLIEVFNKEKLFW